jgi:hypothetical protein
MKWKLTVCYSALNIVVLVFFDSFSVFIFWWAAPFFFMPALQSVTTISTVPAQNKRRH